MKIPTLFIAAIIFSFKYLPAVSDLTVGFFYCYPTDDIIGEKDKSRR